MSEAAQAPLDNRPVHELPFADFSARYLHIAPKTGGVVRFRLNVIQLALERIIDEIRAAKRPVRLIILKARQEGVSTWSIGRMYHYATTRRAVSCFLAAHDDDATKDLFERLRLMYDLAPQRPMIRYSNRTELDFSNPDRRKARLNPGLQSRIRMGTAGRANLGRSKTLRYLHLSEVAFWDHASRVLLSLEQTLPDDAGTVEIIESTANGVGGEFYRRWKTAENPRTRGDWTPVFLAWWMFPEYRRPLRDGRMDPIPPCVADEQEFIAQEAELKGQHGLDDEQLNWRRWAIVNKCGNKLEQFMQEYPATPTEAFLTSGRPIFNRDKLMLRIRRLESEDARRRSENKPPRYLQGKVVREKGSIKFRPHPEGELFIYQSPQPGSRYVIGADSCRGFTQEGEDPDYAEAHVYDYHRWHQVAVYRGRPGASEFKDMLVLLGYLYNTAELVPESNDHGHTVCVGIQEEAYPKLFLRQDVDKLGNVPVNKPGFETNVKTRPMLVDAVDHAINQNLATFNDLPFLLQCHTFVRNPRTGKPEADKGCHDDGVFATALALWRMMHGGKLEAPSTPVDWDRLQPEQQMVKRDLSVQTGRYREAQKVRRWLGR